jgi:isopropylmalate/homocitrate/citramalate synthase
MGFGVTYPGSALPRSIPKIILKMVHDAGVDSSRLEWHGHNDFHKVHINAATAWLYGCDGLNASLLGIGERTGNPPLEGALIEYAGLKGDMNGADPRAITEIADYFRREMGYPIPPNYPFAGSEFNVTRAGIHAEGMRRDERIYNIFDTEAVLGVPPRVAITDKSGVDGIVVWVNEFLGLRGAERLNKLKVHKIARWVMDQYEVHGRTTAITSEEMAEQVRIHLPEYCDAQKDGPSAGRQHGSGRLFSTGAEDGKDGADRS